jgi:hypothetical protein
MLVVSMVSGCGFSPLYGEENRAALLGNLAAIEISPIEQPLGVGLRSNIEENIGDAQEQQIVHYNLAIQLSDDRIPLIIDQASRDRRFDYVLIATYQLVAKTDGTVLDQDIVSAKTSYNIVENAEFSNLVAEEAAGKQAAREVSRSIVTGLSLFFDNATRN